MSMKETGSRVLAVGTVPGYLLAIALIWAPGLVHGQTVTLQQAIEAAEATNRAIRAARLERAKALTEVNIARTYRLPAFSVAALGSQSLAHLGLTFPMGSLGVYPPDAAACSSGLERPAAPAVSCPSRAASARIFS